MIGPLALPFNVFTPGEWTQHMVGLCWELFIPTLGSWQKLYMNVVVKHMNIFRETQAS